MKKKQGKSGSLYSVWLAILAGVVSTALAFILVRRRSRGIKKLPREAQPSSPLPLIHYKLNGLSQAEVAARRSQGQDNTVQLKPRRTKREIIRENSLSIFNLSLVGLAFIQLLFAKPLDALLSVAVLVANIGLNVFQELLAKRRLQAIEASTQLTATAIRDGKVHSIHPNEIVIGDILIAGPGDTLLVDGKIIGDGQLVVDESALGLKKPISLKNPGDIVYAGSICMTGRAAHETLKVGRERKIYSQMEKIQGAKEALTPIEKIIDRILKVLLIIVVVLTGLLLSSYYRLDLGLPVEEVLDAANVIFSIAPAGLFFMILLTYAAGTADLAKLGALVHRARSVETLAQVNVMCFAQAGVLTGTHIEIEAYNHISNPNRETRFTETRIRQVLGDFARSTSLPNPTTKALADSFEGLQRIPLEEAPFMNVYGWSGISLNDDDLRGVFVIGFPDILQPFLTGEVDPAQGMDDSPKPVAWRNWIGKVGGIFKPSRSIGKGDRNQPTGESHNERDKPVKKIPPSSAIQETDANRKTLPEENLPKANLFKRITNRFNKIIRRGKDQPNSKLETEAPEEQKICQVFAYFPEPVALHDEEGSPQLPGGLIPICHLYFSQRIRQDIVETIHNFSQNGVSIKIFSPEPAEKIASLLNQAGLTALEDDAQPKISGIELIEGNPSSLARELDRRTIFGELNPAQVGRLVQGLRHIGKYVAVLGDSVNDIPALRQANLAITLRSSSQSVLSLADIVLLEDSPLALQRVLDKGQRIVTSLLDILKLYLTQILYLVLLILAIRFTSRGFPYTSAQGSLIAALTLTIPSLGLTFWASAGVTHSAHLKSLLAHFILPAAVTMSLTAATVYHYFLATTENIHYAQLTVTYALVGMGLLLVAFIKPPSRLFASGTYVSGDWRPTILSFITLLIFLGITPIPLAQNYLDIRPLAEAGDYLRIGFVIIGWAAALRIIWWIWPKAYTKQSG